MAIKSEVIKVADDLEILRIELNNKINNEL